MLDVFTWTRISLPVKLGDQIPVADCCRPAAPPMRPAVRQPVHRRQLTDVTLLPRCQHETNIRSGADGMIEVREIGSRTTAAAARVITDALIDDPGWLAVGPDHRAHRHAVALRYHRVALSVTHRYGGPIYGAFGPGERLAGVAATFAAGLYPPPAWTIAKFVPGFLLAGPAPIVRGLRFSSIQDAGHPRRSTSSSGFWPSTPGSSGGVRAAPSSRACSRTRPRPSTSTRATRPTFPTTRASASRRPGARRSHVAAAPFGS